MMMKNSQNVIVTGASSQIGFFLLPMLIEHGYNVYAISRHQEHQKHSNDAKVIWIKSDINTNINLEKIDNPSSLIHIAPLWTLPKLLPSIATASVSRIIAFSSTSIYGKATSSNPHETKTVDRLKEAEEKIRVYCNKNDVFWTLFLPTLIYTPGMDQNITTIANFIKRFRFFPVIGKGAGLRQPVRATDLATAVVSALTNSSTFNKTYILAGGEVLTYHQMVERIFGALKMRPRFISIPPTLYKAALLAISSIPKYRHITPQMADRMNINMSYDISPAVKDFGYHPSEFHPLGFID